MGPWGVAWFPHWLQRYGLDRYTTEGLPGLVLFALSSTSPSVVRTGLYMDGVLLGRRALGLTLQILHMSLLYSSFSGK